MIKIYMSDIRNAKMCARGARDFFASKNWDFQDFLKNGIDIETVKACGDAMALQVVEVAQNGRK
ncbi:MAG: hypothetical protein RSC05_12750 [Acinetobacter sp.]